MLFALIPSNTCKALIVFAAAATLLALVAGGTTDRILARMVIQLPILLLVAALGAFIINVLAAIAGTLAAGLGIVAALLAMLIGWTVAGGGSSSFAGLGYHPLLQPAYALALAGPWLAGLTKLRS